MKKPILVVMAAGMGSRYGGMKQIDPVGANGELIIDYSIYDARRAGFETVVFIIKHEIEDVFKAAIGDRLSEVIEVRYAYQQLTNLPEGYTVPEGRVKPWGTAHAVLSASGVIDAPFVVINADDYYGAEAFQVAYDYLTTTPDDADVHRYAMVGYQLRNTVTEHGHVARGACRVRGGKLEDVHELTRIEQQGDTIRYTENDGEHWTEIDGDTTVSMNFWCFHPSFLTETGARFAQFLDTAVVGNPMKAEYYLPTVVSELLAEQKAEVTVLTCGEKWYGVTYQQDKPTVVAAIAQKTAEGMYASPLWGAQG